MASINSLHNSRTRSSHGSICFGANGGSSSRRAWWWNGGSLVMGGAPPMGASASTSPVFTTTDREVKWSVS